MNWEVVARGFFLGLTVSSATFMGLDWVYAGRFPWTQFCMVCVGVAGIIGMLIK